MGNKEKLKFWDDVWLGGTTLKERMPRIYGNVVLKTMMMSDAGVVIIICGSGI